MQDYDSVRGVEIVLNYGHDDWVVAAVADGAALRDWARVLRQAAAQMDHAERRCKGDQPTTWTHAAASVHGGVLRILVMIE